MNMVYALQMVTQALPLIFKPYFFPNMMLKH